MLITKKILFQHVGNAPLIPTYFLGEVLFSIDWVKLFLGFILASVTPIVTVGWVKPLAAYPAKKSMTLNLGKPKPV